MPKKSQINEYSDFSFCDPFLELCNVLLLGAANVIYAMQWLYVCWKSQESICYRGWIVCQFGQVRTECCLPRLLETFKLCECWQVLPQQVEVQGTITSCSGTFSMEIWHLLISMLGTGCFLCDNFSSS
jgi:hypothetical protein